MIERRTLRHEIKDYLIEAIMSGNLKPGERIVETRLAKELNVSQAPVREAIRELEQMNIIETVPHQGAFVKKFSKIEIDEAYIVREALEGMAAQLAAKNITEEQISELQQCIENMEDFVNNKNRAEFAENDKVFHQKIFDIADNKLLQKTYDMVRVNNLFVMNAKLSNRDLADLASRHRELLHAIATRDPIEADRVARAHIREIANEVLANL